MWHFQSIIRTKTTTSLPNTEFTHSESNSTQFNRDQGNIWLLLTSKQKITTKKHTKYKEIIKESGMRIGLKKTKNRKRKLTDIKGTH